MPIYEYRCLSCGRTVEAIQKYSDAPLAKCGHCGGTLEKLVSRTSFHLKGGGWFVNDYGASKSASGDSGGEKDKKASSGTDPKDSGSSSGGSGGCGSGSCGCSN